MERWSAGSWLEDQDFMRMSGLFRDVYLYAIPKAHIADLHLKTLLDDSYTDAVLDLSVQMALDPSVGACSVSFELTDGRKARRLRSVQSQSVAPRAAPGQSAKALEQRVAVSL